MYTPPLDTVSSRRVWRRCLVTGAATRKLGAVPTLARQTDHARAARERGEAALLAAAEALVADGASYAELGVAAIAKQAGFSRATFYAYFTDKRALALRLGGQLAEVLEGEAAAWLRRGQGEVRETLGMMFAVFAAHPGAVRLLTEAATYDPEIAAFWREVHDRFRGAAEARLRADHPELPAETVAARAFVLVWGTEAAFTEHLQAPQAETSAMLDALAVLWAAARGTA